MAGLVESATAVQCSLSSPVPRSIMAPIQANSKATALLGGAPSALDAIRAQQALLASGSEMEGTLLANGVTRRFELAPAGAGVASSAEPCTNFVPHNSANSTSGVGSPMTSILENPENFLASRRVRIGRTNFDKDWSRVRSERITRSTMRRYLGSVPPHRAALLNQVNGWVNRHVEYTEDRAQYGKADYWAGARKTLRSGRGDCEDIALAKMQLLAAAGVPAEDMFLTVARDLVRGADHAVLIVRSGDRYAMLDNSTDEVLDATLGHDYRPILSFGSDQTWLHGV